MRKSLVAVAALFAGLSLGHADLTIVQTVEGGGQSGEQTIKIKGDKSRSDLNQGVSMITDGATGEMTTLMHAGRTYLKVSAAETKTMMDQLQKARGNAEPAKLQPTGKKEKIAGYDCDIFTTSLGTMAATYWIAKDFPNYPAVLDQLQKFQAGSISAMGKGLMPELKDFPGMMIKTEIDVSGRKIVTTFVSLKEDNIDPAIFKIPAGYKEVTSPTLNFQPK